MKARQLHKAAFDRKGVKYPSKDWTVDELLRISQQLTDPSAGTYAIQIEPNRIESSMGTFMRNFGGRIFNEARDKTLYADDVNAIRGAEFDVDLHTRHQVAPAPRVISALPAGTRGMESKLVAMVIGDISRRQSIMDALGFDNVDFVPPPKGPGRTHAAYVYGNAWSMLRLSKSQDASWTVLRWLHTKEGFSGPQLRAIGSASRHLGVWNPAVAGAGQGETGRGAAKRLGDRRLLRVSSGGNRGDPGAQ